MSWSGSDSRFAIVPRWCWHCWSRDHTLGNTSLSLGGHVLLFGVNSLLRYLISTFRFLQWAACLSSWVQMQDARHSQRNFLNRWCAWIHLRAPAVEWSFVERNSQPRAGLNTSSMVCVGWVRGLEDGFYLWRFHGRSDTLFYVVLHLLQKSVPEEDVGPGFSENLCTYIFSLKSKNQGCFNYG